MPIDGVNANLQYNSGPNLATQKKVTTEDASEHARKVAEKKIRLKKDRLKGNVQDRSQFQRTKQNEQKMQQIMRGAHGPEAQQQLHQFNDNKGLQSKLTEAQKDMFRKAMAENPKKGTNTAKALNNLSKQPGFGKAVNNSQQMGTLNKAMIENPEMEKPAKQMLQNRFMQSAKADPKAKSNFLRFGMQQAQKGNMAAVKKAGDMMGSLSKNSIGKPGQKAATNMAQRAPTNGKAMSNVDSFVNNPNVGKMPTFAKTKATELLCKANGKGDVKEGFEKLAGDSKFKSQTAQNKGRFFSTIGSGKASEFRQLTDKSLQALQNQGFPKRSGQVGKFLNKMSGQIQKGGAGAVDVKSAMKAAKSSPLPTPPKLVPMSEDMDDEELARARSQNRASVMQFYNKLQRSYEQSEKKLNSAKYLEDVNSLSNLREPESPNLSALTPEERKFVEERRQQVMQTLGRVQQLKREKARLLRKHRMPPAKRRARAAARRVQGRQAKYFQPDTGKVAASQAFLQAEAGGGPQGLAGNPARAARGQRSAAAAATGTSLGGDIQAQVAAALDGVGGGAMTADKAGQVAQAIASSVAQQVASQVTASLMGGAVEGAEAPDVEMPQQAPAQGQKNIQQGKVDGWGIPRSFERDLGGAPRAAVRPKTEGDVDGPTMAEVANEKWTGKMLVKDPTSIRSLGDLFATQWKDLNRPEMALLKNLGWSQQMWDTKDGAAAKWPNAMSTAFVNLNPTQRESVRKLGFSPHDWDKKVQAFTGGRNA